MGRAPETDPIVKFSRLVGKFAQHSPLKARTFQLSAARNWTLGITGEAVKAKSALLRIAQSKKKNKKKRYLSRATSCWQWAAYATVMPFWQRSVSIADT